MRSATAPVARSRSTMCAAPLPTRGPRCETGRCRRSPAPPQTPMCRMSAARTGRLRARYRRRLLSPDATLTCSPQPTSIGRRWRWQARSLTALFVATSASDGSAAELGECNMMSGRVGAVVSRGEPPELVADGARTAVEDGVLVGGVGGSDVTPGGRARAYQHPRVGDVLA